MRIPVLRGVIDRRILVNFRVEPDEIRKVLPPRFRPKLIRGSAMAGICLIRLKGLHPRFVPGFAGISFESAAHRIAVEREDGDGWREGVYVVRRDTSSRLATWVGGRVFPGVHHLADFEVSEGGGRYEVAMRSRDGSVHVRVVAALSSGQPVSSVFASLREAFAFFEAGSVSYSSSASGGALQGLELRTHGWSVEPLHITEVESSYFDDRRRFPAGSVAFDGALLMRGIPHEWYERAALNAGVQPPG